MKRTAILLALALTGCATPLYDVPADTAHELCPLRTGALHLALETQTT